MNVRCARTACQREIPEGKGYLHKYLQRIYCLKCAIAINKAVTEFPNYAGEKPFELPSCKCPMLGPWCALCMEDT